MKMLLTGILLGGLVLTAQGCKKNEDKTSLPAGHPSVESGMPSSGGNADMPRIDRTVIVPKEVKAKWKSVKLGIKDMTSGNAKEYTVAVGSDLAVPGTKMTVKVLAFLPDFRMDEKGITSASDKQNNPAAQVIVQEPGREDWKGWLYAMHQDVHPFEHNKISLKLVGGAAQ
ncbi:MAG: hypothetical protein ACYC7L_01300 [Nitrospirota bacterium]